MVGKVVRSLGCGGGYTSSTRQRGVSIMGEFMSTIQYNTIWRDRGANPRPTAPEADALTTNLNTGETPN